MLLTTEIQDTTQKALIIAPHETLFVKKLKKQLKEMKMDVYSSPVLLHDLSGYDVCFLVQVTDVLITSLSEIRDTKFIFILFDEDELAQMLSSFAYKHALTHIKVLNLQTYPDFYDKDIETIFWFAFSRTEDIFLHIFHQARTSGTKMKKPKKVNSSFHIKKWLTPTKLILLGGILLILSQFLFLPPLLYSTYSHARAARLLTSQSSGDIRKFTKQGKSSLDAATRLYRFSQPVLHFFSISLPFADLIQVNQSAQIILDKSAELREDADLLATGIFEKDKTPEETQNIIAAKDRLTDNLPLIHEQVRILEAKLPPWNDEFRTAKDQLKEIDASLTLIETFYPYLDTIFARGTQKKYLLLFANNMELRPGGGFIGSFAIADVADYTIRDIRVYDVYDADGQLTTRIEPPAAISTFLEQPFWYLRDSAFSGDFPENVGQAEIFLEYEMNESDFDGAMLLTTTAVKHLLSAVGSLSIPDYKDTITADNFYLKAQLYAEQDFFPGSSQKKSFLSGVMDQMILSLPDADPQALIQQLSMALDQKQMVVYSRDANLQKAIEDQYWSGSMLSPECTVTAQVGCVPDYLYPLDANLGVNKANFFIKRPTTLNVSIDASGAIVNTLTVTYENDSHDGVYPGGLYKNYVQTIIPPNARVLSIAVDGTNISEYDETNLRYKTIGFLLEVEPQQKKQMKVVYQLPTTIIQGDGVYQLILQKQVGAPDYNFTFSMDMPENMTITRHNLSPLAEGDEINYNTSVSSDKIFLIEFSKN